MPGIVQEIAASFILVLFGAMGLGIFYLLWGDDRRANIWQSRSRQHVTPNSRPERLMQPMIQFNHNFQIFVRRVIDLFQHQRREGYQFAVLFVTSQPDISTTVFYTKTQTYFSGSTQAVSRPETATDKTHPTYPQDHSLCNYVVARPDGKDWQQHAEVLLMNKFDMLLQQYQSLRMPECQTVVLYTWLLPCGSCAKAIVRKLGQQRQRRRVVLIYTCKMKDVTENRAHAIVSMLEEAGITVRCEKYNKRMPPA